MHTFLQLPTHDALHAAHLPVLALEERQEVEGEQEGGLQGGRLAEQGGRVNERVRADGKLGGRGWLLSAVKSLSLR